MIDEGLVLLLISREDYSCLDRYWVTRWLGRALEALPLWLANMTKAQGFSSYKPVTPVRSLVAMDIRMIAP